LIALIRDRSFAALNSIHFLSTGHLHGIMISRCQSNSVPKHNYTTSYNHKYRPLAQRYSLDKMVKSQSYSLFIECRRSYVFSTSNGRPKNLRHLNGCKAKMAAGQALASVFGLSEYVCRQ
jgi:hypothetical protein